MKRRLDEKGKANAQDVIKRLRGILEDRHAALRTCDGCHFIDDAAAFAECHKGANWWFCRDCVQEGRAVCDEQCNLSDGSEEDEGDSDDSNE
jgi:hypothetical protein